MTMTIDDDEKTKEEEEQEEYDDDDDEEEEYDNVSEEEEEYDEEEYDDEEEYEVAGFAFPPSVGSFRLWKIPYRRTVMSGALWPICKQKERVDVTRNGWSNVQKKEVYSISAHNERPVAHG